MANYREISQEYAKQGINAAFLLNGSAAFAVMTQFMNIKHELASAVAWGLLVWAGGTAVAALTWLVAFTSTRFVDKSEREEDPKHLRSSDRFMVVGMVFFAISIFCFALGCIMMALALRKL